MQVNHSTGFGVFSKEGFRRSAALLRTGRVALIWGAEEGLPEGALIGTILPLTLVNPDLRDASGTWLIPGEGSFFE